MELRAYWAIIWRRIWLIALIVGIVAVYVGYKEYQLRKTPGALSSYQSTVTIQLGLQANQQAVDPYSSAQVASTLADVLVTGPILSSNEFDTQVAQQIASDMDKITQRYGANPDLGNVQDPGAIGAALGATKVDNLVSITATWVTSPGAWAIANAVGEVSASSMCRYLNYVVPQSASCATTSGSPGVAAQIISNANNPGLATGNANSKQTTYLLLLLVALVIGIALAFLAAYLDDRLYTKDDAIQLLRLPVYGEIPRASMRGRKEQLAPTNNDQAAVPGRSETPEKIP